MLTIFSMPKAFRGHIGIIQRNAIQSWTRLSPKPEIILLGSDEGTKGIAQELGLLHIPEVATNAHGTPLLSDLFRKAEAAASHNVLCYVNADILLLSNFGAAVQKASAGLPSFLLISNRINLDVTTPISFEPDWENGMQDRGTHLGSLGGHTAIDVFVFPRGLYARVPDFGLGRLWFDQWLIKAALQAEAPVVDLSRVAPVIHQNHDYNHVAGGVDQVWRGKEAEYNLQLYGGKPHAYTLLDATHELTANGQIRPLHLRRKRFELQHLAWDIFIRRTARVRQVLGLRRSAAERAPSAGGGR